jgi:hypothetical protein
MSEEIKKDWRVGLSVKVKYRTHILYYEPPHKILEVFPSGCGGFGGQGWGCTFAVPIGGNFFGPVE